MRMWGIIAVIATTLYAVKPAIAADSEEEWIDHVTVAQFLSQCQSYQKWCGDLLGFAADMEDFGEGAACFPDKLPPNAYDAVLSYLRAHPEWSKRLAMDAVLDADEAIWPCPKR